MIGGLLTGLFVAWFLTLFGVDAMVINVLQDFTSIQLTIEHWYVVLGAIGLISGAFDRD